MRVGPPCGDRAFRMHHPKVAEAQVLAYRAFMGEEMVALLPFESDESADEAEMREYCRANICPQVPKYIRFVDSFPMTASGKVKKFELKEQLIKDLGLEDVAKLKMA